MSAIQLRKLFQGIPSIKVEGSLDVDVTGITYDSRRVAPGIVFVAIRGTHVDGHDFITAAISKGAAAIICEQNGFTSRRATKIQVQDTRETLARIASVFYDQPGNKLKMVGVTGTNGKTTVSFLVKHILETAGIRTGLLGTVRYEIGDRVIPASRTTPEALETYQMLAQMVRAGCKACVMEVSSHALEQKRTFGLEFDAALFTNLTQDHLDYHGSMEAYYLAKKKLFSPAAPGGRRTTAVINIDDSQGARLAAEISLEVCLSYGLNNKSVIRASELMLGPDSTQLTVETPSGKFRCTLPLIGRHNVYNALAAVGAGLALGISPGVIARALETSPPVPGRLERIAAGQPFGVFVDYAHTDDALRNVLQTLREITSGRLLLLFGCGGNRDAGKRSKMGAVAAELADFTLITSDNPRKESPGAIAGQIEAGYRSTRTTDYRVELERRRAIHELIHEAKSGDVVLIAGKGHETYQEFEDTVVPFDDRLYARETLEEMGFVDSKAE